MNGRPLDLRWAAEHVPAILDIWYPGTQGGAAVADLLFGDVAPGGKLPFSWPRTVGQVPIIYSPHAAPTSPTTRAGATGTRRARRCSRSGTACPTAGSSTATWRWTAAGSQAGETVTVSVDRDQRRRTRRPTRSSSSTSTSGTGPRPGRSASSRASSGSPSPPASRGPSTFPLGPDELRYWNAAARDWVIDADHVRRLGRRRLGRGADHQFHHRQLTVGPIDSRTCYDRPTPTRLRPRAGLGRRPSDLRGLYRLRVLVRQLGRAHPSGPRPPASVTRRPGSGAPGDRAGLPRCVAVGRRHRDPAQLPANRCRHAGVACVGIVIAAMGYLDRCGASARRAVLVRVRQRRLGRRHERPGGGRRAAPRQGDHAALPRRLERRNGWGSARRRGHGRPRHLGHRAHHRRRCCRGHRGTAVGACVLTRCPPSFRTIGGGSAPSLGPRAAALA